MKFCQLPESEILSIVEPLMDNCLDGSNEGDHAKHVRDFTPRLKAIVLPESLKAQLAGRPHGFFTDRVFIRLFRRSSSIGIVWKQHVSATSDELINQAIFIEQDNRILIDHCMIC